MTPAPSLCGVMRGAIGGRLERPLTSDGLTPDALTCTQTSPSRGTGSSSSPTVSTSRAAPLRSYHAAFIYVLLGCASRTGRRYTSLPLPALQADDVCSCKSKKPAEPSGRCWQRSSAPPLNALCSTDPVSPLTRPGFPAR